MKKFSLSAIVALVATAVVNTASAGINYWDPNGTTVNNSDSHTWEGALWATSTTPTASTVAFTEGNLPAFIAHAGTLVYNGTYTVTANANHTIGGMFNGALTDGCVTNLQINGSGVLNIAAGLQGFEVGTSGNMTINSVLGGTGTLEWQGGGGSLYLWNANTFTGGTYLKTFNGLSFNNNNAFGTGIITNEATLTVLSTPTTDGGGNANGANSPLSIANDMWYDSVTSKLIFVGGSPNAPITWNGNWKCNAASGQTISLDLRTDTMTLNGVFSGAQNFLLTNSSPGAAATGVLVFNNANTYTGTTTIAATSGGLGGLSVLRIGTGGTTGTLGAGAVTDNATLIFNRSDIPTVANAISGSGVVILTNSSGGANFTGALTYTGGTFINAGSTLTISGSGTMAANLITNNGTINYASSGNSTLSSAISGSGNINKSSTGNLTLSSTANSFTGKVSATGGTLTINNGDTLGTAPASPVADQLTLDNATLALGTSASVTLSANRGITLGAGGGTMTMSSKNLTVPGIITGVGALTKAGSTTLTLSAANTYQGGTTITGGLLNFDNNSAVGTGPITVTPAGICTLRNTVGGVQIANNMTLNVGGGQVIDLLTTTSLKFSGIISGSGALVRGNGGGAGDFELDGVNTFTGGLTLKQGGLVLGSSSALGTGTFTIGPTVSSGGNIPSIKAATALTGANAVANPVTFVGLPVGTSSTNSFIVSGTNALELSGAVTLTGNDANITNNNSGGLTLSGAISGAFGITNSGTGVTKLTGTSSYTGNTVVNGTLQVNGSIASSAAVIVNAGGTLKGSGTVPATTLNSGATVNAGSSPGALTSGAMTWNAGATNSVEINDFNGTAGGNPGWDLINADSLTIAGGPVTIAVSSLNGNTAGDAANFNNGQDYDLTIVHTTSGITGSVANLSVNVAGFSNALGISGGFFQLVIVGNDLVLQYRRAAVSSAVSPVSQTIVAGSTANLSITATGSGTLGYQWYRGATALANGDLGGRVSGATSSALAIASTVTSDSDTAYHCTVTGINGTTSDSGNATLTVVNPPVITSPAAASTAVVDAGTTQTLSVTVSDPTAMSYQWKKGGVNVSNGAFDNHSTVSGSTTATLVLANVRGADSGDYTCVVQNVAGAATSLAQTLAVNDPVITQQPVASTFECSSSNALSVTAIGSTNANGVLTYQWYTPDPSGTAITDATNSVLSFPTVSFANAGSYSVVVSNAFGASITSSVVVVTIEDTNAPVISVNGGAATVECHGSYTDAGATATDGCDGSVSVVTSGSLDVNTVGTYTVTYTATDSHGNASTATRVVTVQDTTAPTLALAGQGEITISCGQPYTDAGASASDLCAGDLTSQISVNLGGLNPAAPTVGDYTITYNVQDPAGNAATPVTRLVHVIDNTPPAITVNGATTVTVQCHSSYTDAGATANDACTGAVTPTTSGTVDANTVGSYTLTYTATDGANSATATRVVNVVDTTPPVITLNGDAAVTNECHTSYTDPGASASDDCDANASVTVTGTVDLDTVGVYTRTYTATDASGNHSSTTRQITVSDTTAPVITVTGDNPASVDCHTSYTDAGATATDACDSNPTVTSSGTVDENTPGSYTITYTATDASGNTASATRVVNVGDTTAPTVTLNGDAAVTVECHSVYVELGATTSDTCDTNASVTTSGAVDANTPGVYTVTYSSTDASGNTGSATRVVTVSDTLAPVISLNGSPSMNVECHSGFTDPGATANDACEGPVNVNVGGTVDANTVGDYTLTYAACDSGNRCSTVTRVVHVADTVAPVITITGQNPVNLCLGSPYTEAGATAADDCFGSVAAPLTGGSVDTNTAGSYTLTYTATDAVGNTATATRVVNVANCGVTIVTQPANALKQPQGTNVTLSVVATTAIGDLTYQWYEQGVAIQDATGPSYTFAAHPNPAAPHLTNVTYNVVVTGLDNHTATSANALVTVMVDKGHPSVTLTSPKPNIRADSFTITGTATDNKGGNIASIIYQYENQNGGGTSEMITYALPTAGSNNKSFTIPGVTFPAGTNTLRVWAVDLAGNVSTAPYVVKGLFSRVTDTFTLNLVGDGNGTVTAKTLAPNETVAGLPISGGLVNNSVVLNLYKYQVYTLTFAPDATPTAAISSVVSNAPSAVAVPGNIAGTDTTKKVTYTFRFNGAEAHTVYFNRNRKVDMAGSYNGVFSEVGNPTMESSGLVQNMNISRTGTYSLTLVNEGTTLPPIKGVIAADGTTIANSADHKYVISGYLDWANSQAAGSKQFIGTIANTVSGWTATFVADRAEKTLVAGTKKTMVIPTAQDGPTGESYATIKDSASARIFTFSLADNAKPVSCMAPASASGNFPIYVYPKYAATDSGAKSVLFGTWNSGSSQVTLNWVKKAGGVYKPEGFTNTVVADISSLSTGLVGQHTLTISTATLNLTYQMQFNGTNKVQLVTDTGNSTNSIAVKQDSNGKLTVVFNNGTSKSTGYAGVLEDSGTAGGYAIPTGGNDSGLIQVH